MSVQDYLSQCIGMRLSFSCKKKKNEQTKKQKPKNIYPVDMVCGDPPDKSVSSG